MKKLDLESQTIVKIVEFCSSNSIEYAIDKVSITISPPVELVKRVYKDIVKLLSTEPNHRLAIQIENSKTITIFSTRL